MFENDRTLPSLTDSVDLIRRQRWGKSPDWLTRIRDNGKELFSQKGLPTVRVEEWKYTDVSPISRHLFSPPAPNHVDLNIDQIEEMVFGDMHLIFINGFYSAALSSHAGLPDGVEITGLGEAIKRDHPLVMKHLAAHAKGEESSFIALNEAFIEDGAFIHIPRGIRLEQPIHLVYLNTGKEMPAALYPRNLIIVDEDAEASIIEDYIGEMGTTYFTDAVTEIFTGDRARVFHYKLQRENEASFHIAFIQARQGAGSRFESHSITFGGRLTRNNIHSVLTGADADCVMNGLYMIDGSQHVDNHTLIRHDSPNCRSSELYHGILDGGARGVFNGKIYVARDAQQTDSRQTSRSLLLSRESAVDAKPQLEIFADDVKCTHGATVGRLDEDALYYLRSRGLAAEEAEKMLTLAFARRITDSIGNETLRKETGRLLDRRLDEWRQKQEA